MVRISQTLQHYTLKMNHGIYVSFLFIRKKTCAPWLIFLISSARYSPSTGRASVWPMNFVCFCWVSNMTIWAILFKEYSYFWPIIWMINDKGDLKHYLGSIQSPRDFVITEWHTMICEQHNWNSMEFNSQMERGFHMWRLDSSNNWVSSHGS